ncbi:unnamed protein product [Parnassius apollo]|uniref:(apollo) hypothetical protein n=1 Tax=Parnassius apollo TaxID=110799 RepID=A0A8S3VYZ1_PARAO|nr:unnamed protein product [Parnassius apollo]
MAKNYVSNFRGESLLTPNGKYNAPSKSSVSDASSKITASNAYLDNKENNFKFESRPALVLYKAPFKPTLPTTQIVEPVSFDLATEKRAAEREKFERRLKEKDEKNERLRQQKEREHKETEKRVQAELRAKLIHHAKPIPTVGLFIPEKSSKPLTVSETLKFVRRFKQN